MNVMSYIEKGGPVMYILLLINIIGYTIMLVKLVQFILIKKNKAAIIKQRILDSIQSKGLNLKDESVILELVKDEINAALTKVETGLNTVKIIAVISPLLGLLGTVIGILTAFTAISQKGLSDPAAFAGGISVALITTVGGLIVAIPHNIGYNYLSQMVNNIEVNLELDILPKVLKEEFIMKKRNEPLNADLTPFIDIAFLLLIFFLVSSVFKKNELALSLNLPTTENIVSEINNNEIVVELDENNVSINGKIIKFDKIEEKLVLIDSSKEIYLRIDKDVKYERIMKLFDLLKKNDLNNLILVSKKES